MVATTALTALLLVGTFSATNSLKTTGKHASLRENKNRPLHRDLLQAVTGANRWARQMAMGMGGTPEEILTDMVLRGDLKQTQYDTIAEDYLHGMLSYVEINDLGHHVTITSDEAAEAIHAARSELKQYLLDEASTGHLSDENAHYISSVLGLFDSPPDLAAAPAATTNGYTGNGIVGYLGKLDPEDELDALCSDSSSNQYNGIWGYSTGGREYSLSCSICGLHIIDFTDPTNPVRVQAIPMPGGNIWRDVETHTDPDTGKTYAYIAGQAGADLWVIDLSYLSSDAAQVEDSNPIPAEGINEVSGCQNRGHTIVMGTFQIS